MPRTKPSLPPETTPPTILYKYFPPERIDIFETLELRFSPPSDFNDVFDSHFLVQRNHAGGAMSRAMLRSRIGILCLTESPDDHLMWVNYASNHTGFVLGFNATAAFFNEDGRILRKVRYKKHPTVLQEVDVNGCFYKSDVWTHEHEWRCVREFAPSEPRNVGFDPTMIREIVLGAKIESWQIARIALAASVYQMKVQFFVATTARKSWTIENKPKKIMPCQVCRGRGYTMQDEVCSS